MGDFFEDDLYGEYGEESYGTEDPMTGVLELTDPGSIGARMQSQAYEEIFDDNTRLRVAHRKLMEQHYPQYNWETKPGLLNLKDTVSPRTPKGDQTNEPISKQAIPPPVITTE